MNEQQKKLIKDAAKNFGFIVISVAVLYMLSGGSLDVIKTFTEADIIVKIFYVVFGVVVVYYTGTIIRMGVEYVKSGKGVHVNRQSLQTQQPAINNPGILDYPEPEKTIFEKFDSSLSFNMDAGEGLIPQLKGKIESFYDNLDSLSVEDLEQQYKEMDGLRKIVNKEVSDLYEQFKRLEQQMQLTLGMIRTKRAMGERIRQLRGK